MCEKSEYVVNNIQDNLNQLLQSRKLSDCSFRVGKPPNQKLFDGHKLILSIGSPVFEAMFYGELKEMKYPIDIEDVEPESFAIFIKYLYTDRVNFETVDKAIRVCYVAHKYMVNSLVNHCVVFCEKNLSTDNVCQIYEFSKTFDLMQLKKSCVDSISDDINVILENPGFVDIQISTLVDIFNMDSLKLEYELGLYTALERYINANEQQAKDCPEYRELIRNIRYLSMTAEQFAKGPGSSKLLTEEEKLTILMNIVSKCPKDYYMPEGFRTDKRKIGEREGNFRNKKSSYHQGY